jgi:TolB-like protein/tetratricopeptide (TPR) repeat protein
MAQRIGPYDILQPIGEGSMGVVYEALDRRLDRRVALKLMTAQEEDSRQRFWREARLAARVSHPNLCHIYDVGEHDGQPYLAMELLSGESLARRIERGPVPPKEALALVGGILDGLEALHGRGIVHRDLKPSNVFLVDGAASADRSVKLLDFGLARPLETLDVEITQPGIILGTPRYMAPEQWSSQSVGPGADLFAVAAILFELLTGRPAFDGRTAVELFRAIITESPPALTGDSMIEAVDRVLHRGLAKNVEDRFPSASAMKSALEACLVGSDRTVATGVEVRTVTRLLVLPFRLLRPDDQIGFLSFALADAITTSLTGLRSLVVQSSAAGRQAADAPPDLAALAEETKVDAVLVGTLLRSGQRVRLSTQLLQVPSGTVLASVTEEAGLDDVFRLQDELTDKVTRSLAVPLGERVARLRRVDVPASGEAYERYLRANDLAIGSTAPTALQAARELYEQCLELDPEFAPAWAQLGRVERLLAKYGGGAKESDALEHRRRAERAFDRALAANPDLPVAHNLFTYYQIEELGDAPGAMERLLKQVAHLPDPNLYAGLVGACRFCGLLRESLAAHQQARRLDPHIPTSVTYTYWFLGEDVRAAETEQQDVPFMRLYSLIRMRKMDELRRLWEALERRDDIGDIERAIVGSYRALSEGDTEAARAHSERILDSAFKDPEGLFFVGHGLGRGGHHELALEVLGDIVAHGFYCLHLVPEDFSFPAFETDPRYLDLKRRSAEASAAARRRFVAAGGERLLGITTPADATSA